MKGLFRYVLDAEPRRMRRISALSGVAGVAGAALLALVNRAANGAAVDSSPGLADLLGYGLVFLLFAWSARTSLIEANAVIEALITSLRVRITDKIRHTELPVVERLGRGELYTGFSQTTSYLSLTFPLMINSCQNLLLVLCCAVYIATLSLVAFAVLVAGTAVAFWWYMRSQGELRQAYGEVLAAEAELLDSMGHVVNGFKELKMNAAKSGSLFSRFTGLTARLGDRNGWIAEQQVSLMLFSTVFVYSLLATLTYVVPQYAYLGGGTGFKLTSAFLFAMGPLVGVATVAPLLWRAESAFAGLQDLERRLAESCQPPPTDLTVLVEGLRTFSTVDYREMVFHYREAGGEVSFTSGPWNLSVSRGETLFIVGGNGSGKSTVLKLLSGLYQPAEGEIAVDGVGLGPDRRYALRELFACVFTDYHLFDRFYGHEGVDPELVNGWLRRVDLAGKVSFSDGRFSTLRLSTGQRKRLALVTAIVEDKSVYVFDEWAADQDQQFRKQFYTEILPELRRKGKTSIVVTHDERYWDCADRLVKLDLGRIVEERRPEPPADTLTAED